MADERWATDNKLEQLQGITTLYKNVNESIKNKTLAEEKKQDREVKDLRVKNLKLRKVHEGLIKRGNRNNLPPLNEQPKKLLAFKNLTPDEIEEELKQSIFSKNKELDRLCYKRHKLEDILLNNKLEVAEFKKEADDAPENYQWEQEIANQIQNVSTKLNAARGNQDVYKKAVDMLEKDAIRFDEVLDGLRKDMVHQSDSIIKGVEIGQKVTEELKSLQQEYKNKEKEVRANMKMRDRAIRGLKSEIKNARSKGLSRDSLQSPTIEDPVFEDGEDNSSQGLLELHIKREVYIMENVLEQIKEVAKVHKMQDIIPRIQEQLKQKERLQNQIKENTEELERIQELHNQLDVMYEVVKYHTMTDEANMLKEEKTQLRNEIEKESNKVTEAQTELVTVGQKIVDIRTALLTMNVMLDTAYPIEDPLMQLSQISEASLEPKALQQPNTDAITLADHVTRKVQWLMEQVKTKPKQFTLMPTVSKFRADDDADNIVSDMLDDLEDWEDPEVPTRKSIKAESQKIVEMYSNPRALFQDNKQTKYKKHQCF